MTMKKGILVDKSFEFAISVINVYKYLAEDKKEYVMSKQLLRSGTAVGALIKEAQNAESKADFIHKLAIAQKECDETIYWLELLKATNYLTVEKFEKLFNEGNGLLKMLRSAILTSKQTHNS